MHRGSPPVQDEQKPGGAGAASEPALPEAWPLPDQGQVGDIPDSLSGRVAEKWSL